jgi:hypothetical protein
MVEDQAEAESEQARLENMVMASQAAKNIGDTSEAMEGI